MESSPRTRLHTAKHVAKRNQVAYSDVIDCWGGERQTAAMREVRKPGVFVQPTVATCPPCTHGVGMQYLFVRANEHKLKY